MREDTKSIFTMIRHPSNGLIKNETRGELIDSDYHVIGRTLGEGLRLYLSSSRVGKVDGRDTGYGIRNAE